MKARRYLNIFFLFIAVACFSTFAAAQDPKPAFTPPGDVRPAQNQQLDVRGTILRQLGLSREQFQQIRRVNAERKPLMDAANMRLKAANRALDEAIYADQVNEVDVQARLKEFQLAQADVAKIRFTSEFSIRRILTPEQLLRFRELRQQFERERQMPDTQGPQGAAVPAGTNVKTPRNVRPLIKALTAPNQKRP